MAKEGGGEGENHLFLGEPQWENLPGGRVRCVQTGHEMPLAAQPTYATTKKCRLALFDAALQKRTPPLNFFEQSTVAKDKIVCKLTGVVLNKKEDAVWKHMLGKKFEQRLAEMEAAKLIARKDVEMAENASEKPSSPNDVSRYGDKARRKTKEKTVVVEEKEEEEENEDANSDGSDFWMPPAGDRWDFDSGSNDRWSVPSQSDPEFRNAVQINGHTNPAALQDSSTFNNGDTEMLEGDADLQESDSSDDNDSKISTKRMSTSFVPSKQKKRAKRRKQKGV